MQRLHITADGRTRTIALGGSGQMTVGSAGDNDIVIASRGVSRHHARLLLGGVPTVVDTASKNGIVVNGSRVKDTPLASGTVVQLGSVTLWCDEISTSDVVLDRRFMIDLYSATSGLTSGSTPVPERAGEALRWARECDGTRPLTHPDVEEARTILGASSLLALSAGREPVLHVVCGVLPSSEVLERITHVDAPDGWTTAGPADGLRLAAAFPPEEPSAQWKTAFMELILARLAEPLTRKSNGPPPAKVALPRMIVGPSPLMRRVVDDIAAFARTTLDVLVLGETGTGKELVARALHEHGRGNAAPWVAINCAAVPAELLEAELFGIAKGVATGVEPREGVIAQASGGTLFLDEIGDMPLPLQAKLLRVLQERELRKVGARQTERVDVRVVASTNHDVAALIARGAFRADLYYRLRGAEIYIPPLRERREDIPALTTAFIGAASAVMEKRVTGLSEKAARVLLDYDWPGNVRELEHAVARAVALCKSGESLASRHFVLPLTAPRSHDPASTSLHDLEHAAIERALATANGNKKRAAELLGISRQTLYERLRKITR